MGIFRWQKSRALVLLALAVSLGAFGCSKPTGTVSGKVSYKNSPLKGGNVIFLMADGKTEIAEIQEDGSYNFPKPIPAGPVKIGVQTSFLKPGGRFGGPRSNPPPADAEHPPNKGPDPAEMAKKYVYIPEKYETPESSGKEYTVTTGKQECPINLD